MDSTADWNSPGLDMAAMPRSWSCPRHRQRGAGRAVRTPPAPPFTVPDGQPIAASWAIDESTAARGAPRHLPVAVRLVDGDRGADPGRGLRAMLREQVLEDRTRARGL